MLNRSLTIALTLALITAACGVVDDPSAEYPAASSLITVDSTDATVTAPDQAVDNADLPCLTCGAPQQPELSDAFAAWDPDTNTLVLTFSGWDYYQRPEFYSYVSVVDDRGHRFADISEQVGMDLNVQLGEEGEFRGSVALPLQDVGRPVEVELTLVNPRLQIDTVSVPVTADVCTLCVQAP